MPFHTSNVVFDHILYTGEEALIEYATLKGQLFYYTLTHQYQLGMLPLCNVHRKDRKLLLHLSLYDRDLGTHILST